MLLVLVLLVLASTRLGAADVLWAWDDGSTYGLTSGSSVSIIASPSGSSVAGGDGWNTDPSSGFPVGWMIGGGAAEFRDGPFNGGTATFLDTDTASNGVTRALPQALTPTASQPLWFACVLQGANLQLVAHNQSSAVNEITFGSNYWIGTGGARLDGSMSDNSPIVWSLDNSDSASASSMEVDDTAAHLFVLEVQPSLVSFWYFPSTTGSVTTPPSATVGLSNPSMQEVTFQACASTVISGLQGNFLVTDIAIGSSFTAVTNLGMPHVTAGFAPATGVNTGGEVVTVTGTNFDATTGVSFGSTSAAAVRVVSSTTLAVTTPAHANGLVDVIVSNAVGSVVHPNGFTFAAPSAADPSLLTAPQITTHGSVAPGASWTVDTGAWTPTPGSFGYYWISSPDGQLSDAQPISGATTNQYSPTVADLGTYLAAVVTPQGTTHPATSAWVQVVAATTGTSGGSSGTATGGLSTSAAAVTSGTAGSSCGLGGGAGLVLLGAWWLRRGRRGAGAAPR